MLHPDPSKRLSIDECRKHSMYKWIDSHEATLWHSSLETAPQSEDTRSRFQSIISGQRFQLESDNDDQDDYQEQISYEGEAEVFDMDQDVDFNDTSELKGESSEMSIVFSSSNGPGAVIKDLARNNEFGANIGPVATEKRLLYNHLQQVREGNIPIAPSSYLEYLNESDYLHADAALEVDHIPFRNNSSQSDLNKATIPPSFHDAVKKSTRFITAVPADEVLTTVERMLLSASDTPLGKIERVELDWSSFCLQVWAADSVSGPATCALQVYLMPLSTPSSPDRHTPCNSLGSWYPGTLMFASSSTQTIQTLFLVEFVRGSCEIFIFKRFYLWVRKRLSELVKRDYDLKLFDQAGSPMYAFNLSPSSSMQR